MVSHSSDPSRRPRPGQGPEPERTERVARVLARAGISSRREAEKLIEAGRIALNGELLTSPAVNVGKGDILTLDGEPVAAREPARLWRHHKQAGLLTTHKDPKGRATVFENLPAGLPRVISVGRLDLNSEGLLLLTNDGDLARQMELPQTGLVRRYRARAFGRASQEKLDRLKDGITIEGVSYGPIKAHLDGGKGANVWVTLELAEGKNREVRKVLEAVGLKVNRLIRTAYGPFELGDLAIGAAVEVPSKQVKLLLKGELEMEAKPAPTRRPAQPTVRSRGKPVPTAVRRPGRAKPKAAKARPAEEEAPMVYKAGWARPKRKVKPGAKPGQAAKPGPGKPAGRPPR